VGFAAGGGHGAYSPTIARYINRYIPGNLSTVVENLDGAGSVIAANHLNNKAERNGSRMVADKRCQFTSRCSRLTASDVKSLGSVKNCFRRFSIS